MTIAQDIQLLSTSARVELFELDSTAQGGGVLRFHNGLNGLLQPVIWQGLSYTPGPIEATGFEYSGQGQAPRPRLKVANVNGLMGALVRETGDLLGAKLTRRRTLAKYLDAENYPQRRNLLTYSEALLAGGGWTIYGLSGVSASIFDPKGGTSAFEFSCTLPGVFTSHYINKVVASASPGSGTQMTFSMYVKCSDEITFAALAFINNGQGFSSNIFAYYDLIGMTANKTTATAADIVDIGGGWRRISITANTTGAGGVQVRCGTATSITTMAHTAVGGERLYMYGAQLEIGPMSDYQPVGASFSRNPHADPTQGFADDIFYIERKASENKMLIEFELATAYDVRGVNIPSRPFVQNACPWRYRVNDGISSACNYNGTRYFDESDNPVASLSLDKCGKRESSCTLRFGNVRLPFGGFPGAGLTR